MKKQEVELTEALIEYSKLYKNRSGILNIQCNDFASNSIIVFFDHELLKENPPTEYKDVDIDFYDVKTVLHNSKKILEHLAKQDTDWSDPENRTTLDFFTSAIVICERLLKDQTNVVPGAP